MHCTGQNSGHLPHGKHRFTSMNATSRGRFFLCPTSSGVSGIRSSLRRRLMISIALILLLSPVLQPRGQALSLYLIAKTPPFEFPTLSIPAGETAVVAIVPKLREVQR